MELGERESAAWRDLIRVMTHEIMNTLTHSKCADIGVVARGGDKVSRHQANYRNSPNPTFATHGPTTRRQFFDLLRRNRCQRS